MNSDEFDDFNEISLNKNLSDIEESLFNSKLFFGLHEEKTEEQILIGDMCPEESENTPFASPTKNKTIDSCLTHELLEELDSSTECPSTPKKPNSVVSSEDLSLEHKTSEIIKNSPSQSKKEENSSEETTSTVNEEATKNQNQSLNQNSSKSNKNKFGHFLCFYPCFITNDNCVLFNPLLSLSGRDNELIPKELRINILPNNKKFINKTKKKFFVSREGDWKCPKCKNLNFAFRKKCNKCGLSKEEPEEKGKKEK